MRKILSNCPVSCFADEISVSLDRQIQVLNELGIKFVEFRSADGTGVADFTDEQAKEAKKRLDAAGIRVSAVGSPIGKIGIEDDFEAHMKKLQRIERIADIFETPYIRMFSFYLPENADQYPLKQYDFVIDAIDTVSAKIELAVRCYNQHIPFISCMGAGNKLQPYFKIADLYQTSVCPLARVMRRELKKRGVKQCTVVYSTEDPQKPCLQSTQPGIKPIPGSLSFVPSSAGLLLASHVIQHLVCKK